MKKENKKITTVSIGDTHGRNVFSSADIELINKIKPDYFFYTGDFTSSHPLLHLNNMKQGYDSFTDINDVKHLFKDIFVIGGNHCTFLDKTHEGYYKNISLENFDWAPKDVYEIYEYIEEFIENTKGLKTGGAEFHVTDEGVKILTIPHTEPIDFLVEKFGEDPWAFHFDDEIKKNILKLIEDNGGEIDIISSHGPPKGYTDKVSGKHVGSEFMLYLVEKYNPKLYLCGHIHDAQGKETFRSDSITTIIDNNSQPVDVYHDEDYDDNKVYISINEIEI